MLSLVIASLVCVRPCRDQAAQLRKIVQSELVKIGKNGQLWRYNVKASMHKAARDEMDSIVLSS